MLFGVILLAAGRSSRMGQPKLALPWGETTILGHLISQWERLDANQIAVVHNGEEKVLSILDRLHFPVTGRLQNPHPDGAMFSSIQCAATWSGWRNDLTHFALALGDQPHLKEQTLRALLVFAAQNPQRICQPQWKGRPKHPVVLPRSIFLRLRSTEAENLRDFLRTENPASIKLDDPGLDLDLDFPEDYRRALGIYFGTTAA